MTNLARARKNVLGSHAPAKPVTDMGMVSVREVQFNIDQIIIKTTEHNQKRKEIEKNQS